MMDKPDNTAKQLEELLTDIKLRAEFEFDEQWVKMQHDPVFSAMIDPRVLRSVKRITKHGYMAGVQNAVLLLIEKVATDMME